MAKTSVIAAIRAKPNQRGVTSHLPLVCSTKTCENDFYVAQGKFSKRIRKCPACYSKPATANAQQLQALEMLGLLTPKAK